MKKHQSKSLKLTRETLRSLTNQALSGAVGGASIACTTSDRCTAASCATQCAGATCLPCTNTSNPTTPCTTQNC